MSANPRQPVANMQNLMVQLGAAVANTVISGSAMHTDVSTEPVRKVVAKKTARRR
jgi:hypothetical protein